jgi:hypothetical protein
VGENGGKPNVTDYHLAKSDGGRLLVFIVVRTWIVWITVTIFWQFLALILVVVYPVYEG